MLVNENLINELLLVVDESCNSETFKEVLEACKSSKKCECIEFIENYEGSYCKAYLDETELDDYSVCTYFEVELQNNEWLDGVKKYGVYATYKIVRNHSLVLDVESVECEEI